jgi:enoyl-CoA hydratase/carnithine racemase
MYETIQYEVDKAEMIAEIVLKRPERTNALSGELIGELTDAIETAEDDDNVRVIIISGYGGNFSAGYDMSGSGHTEGVPTVDEQLDRFEDATNHVHAVWECNKPILAAVEGYCLAGGSDLAMTCDQVIAAEGATFGYPGIRMGGVPPALIYPFVMNLHEAKELLLSGKLVDATRASELVNRVVPADELMKTVKHEADEIKKVPGNGARIMKNILNGVAESQGARPMFKYSEMFDVLGHQTEYGKHYYEVAADTDFGTVLEYLNEQDKGMKPDQSR